MGLNFVCLRNSKKLKADTKITSLSVFKKPFKDEKRLKDIKETKEETKRNKKVKERSSNIFWVLLKYFYFGTNYNYYLILE